MPKTKKLITCTIDGKQITVPDGTLVIEAARMNGIDVPNFCYEPSLRPWGSCRICTVEILLVGCPSKEEDLHGAGQEYKVQPYRPVAHVASVQLDSLAE